MIRGLGQETRSRFLIVSKLNNYFRAEFTSLAASSWLGIRLQLIGNVILIGVICVAIVGRTFDWVQVNYYLVYK